MTQTTLRDHLDRLVADEPALGLDLPTIVSDGRRLRRRRRLVAGGLGTAAAVAVTAAVAVPLAVVGDGGQDRLVLTKPVPVAAEGASPEQALTASQQRIADAI